MRKTVALDVDGVLARYTHWQGVEHIGEPLPGAVEFTQRLAQFADILIYTTRCCEKDCGAYTAEQLKSRVKRWLDQHGFSYYAIYTGQGKPLCAAIIDDRAVACEPQVFKQTAYDEALFRTKMLCGVVERQER